KSGEAGTEVVRSRSGLPQRILHVGRKCTGIGRGIGNSSRVLIRVEADYDVSHLVVLPIGRNGTGLLDQTSKDASHVTAKVGGGRIPAGRRWVGLERLMSGVTAVIVVFVRAASFDTCWARDRIRER